LESARDPLLDSAPGRAAFDPAESRALLARARVGDDLALNDLVARYWERLRRIVRVRLGPALRAWVEADDVVQETFRAALAGRSGLLPEGESELLDWLARIATHRIRDLADQARAERRDARRVEPLDAPSGPGARARFAASATGVSEHAFRREVRDLLDETVAGLSESYREVILWRDYYGAAWDVVARHLGNESVHAIQQLHQRAWIKVRTLAAPRLGGLRED